ncbi:MAG TPA: membrane protein insertion efficiency factor YidD [Nitrospinota bacterium]|nr:membrane protein insertion efficiency factor YidD [Nitrospinota bacterium]
MLKKISVFLIKIYQYIISPVLPPSCRFYPTCSEYTLEAINEFGFAKGLLYAIKRIFKCHPFHVGGYDPIILKEERK